MELLILVMAIPPVIVFACAHAYAAPDRKSLSLRGNMGVPDIGIAGYAVVLSVVLLVMARLFAATPVARVSR